MMWGHWTLVHTPDHIFAPDALALKWGGEDVNGNYFFLNGCKSDALRFS